MFAFLIKKAFFDLWDNLFRIFALNMGYVAIISLTLLAQGALAGNPAALEIGDALERPLAGGSAVRGLLQIALLLLGAVAASLFTAGTAEMTSQLADYKSPEWRTFVDGVRRGWLPAVLLVATNSAFFFFFLFLALPTYARLSFGILPLALLGWLALAWLLASQMFFPLVHRLGDGFGKAVRKCFILLFDNTAFTTGLFVTLNISAPYVLGLFLLTFLGLPTRLVFLAVPLLILPGPAAAVLLVTDAFKLRMYKYDHLEQQPAGVDRRKLKVPWDALLAADREQVGVRTLRGMIFPWKE